MPPRSRGKNAPSLVLDSWALLAWLGGEPGAARVREELDRAEAQEGNLLLSVINGGEVYYRLIKTGRREQAAALVEDLRRRRFPIRLIPATNRRVWQAAEVKALYPIAYADAFAAALAHESGLPLLTGDPEFAAVERDGYCQIAWIEA